MPPIREALLPYTIHNAAQIPFYRELWREADYGAVRSIKDMCALPAVSKARYRTSLMFEAQALTASHFITHTTGTTGELTWRHRSAAEASLINELFSERYDPTKPAPSDLALVIRHNRHGMALPMPGRVRTVPIGMNDDIEVSQGLAMLDATYHFAEARLRPTMIIGESHDVAILAQAANESSVNSTIRSVYVTGFLDSRLRCFLATSFCDAQIIEKYSLTEIFGGAARAGGSRSFVLDPFVIGEVVDERGVPVGVGGVGELVLTELFPFVQMQPLVRYLTGDIVAVDRMDDSGDLQFQWWGRRQDCVKSNSEDPRWLLGYGPIADWLSQEEAVARHAFKSYLSAVKSIDLGPPCVTIRSNGDGVIMVDVGIRFNPWLFPDAAQNLGQKLWAALRSMLSPLIDQLRVQLTFRHVSKAIDDFSTLSNCPSYCLGVRLLNESIC